MTQGISKIMILICALKYFNAKTKKHHQLGFKHSLVLKHNFISILTEMLMSYSQWKFEFVVFTERENHD